MSAYLKFSELLQNTLSAHAPSKPPKPPKIAPAAVIETLGVLGALGGAEPNSRDDAASLIDRAPASRDAAPAGPDAGIPIMLADGRRLYRFLAHAIPLVATADAAALLDQARWCGTVLVADGRELIVVERWQSNLPPETLEAIKRSAAGIIAALRGEARR